MKKMLNLTSEVVIFDSGYIWFQMEVLQSGEGRRHQKKVVIAEANTCIGI
jgi:hypothetical protein